MTEPTTELPTEIGLYLFLGSREGRADLRDLVRGQRVELVRVVRDGSGRLMHVGLDVFHKPQAACGIWVRIDEDVARMKALAEPLLFDEATCRLVPVLFTGSWARSRTRSWVVSDLVGPFKDDASVAVAERMFDRAVALGILVPDQGDYWKLSD